MFISKLPVRYFLCAQALAMANSPWAWILPQIAEIDFSFEINEISTRGSYLQPQLSTQFSWYPAACRHQPSPLNIRLRDNVRSGKMLSSEEIFTIFRWICFTVPRVRDANDHPAMVLQGDYIWSLQKEPGCPRFLKKDPYTLLLTTFASFYFFIEFSFYVSFKSDLN